MGKVFGKRERLMNEEKEKKVLIVGTGALATLFASHLSASGVDVTMLGSWEAAINALNERGARRVDAAGNEFTSPVRARRQISRARHAILLVKSWQTEQAAEKLKESLTEDGVVLTLQNGLGNGEILQRVLGAERVIQGVTTSGAALLAPGIVREGGEGLISAGAHPSLGFFDALLTGAGFHLARVPDIRSLVWGKLVVNTAINPLTALLNLPNGELLKNPETRDLMGKLALETAAIARRLGISLAFDDPVRTAEHVAKRTASNISSMLQDLRRGAPTEIDSICGAVWREGKRVSLPAPYNQFCFSLISAMVNRGKIRKKLP